MADGFVVTGTSSSHEPFFQNRSRCHRRTLTTLRDSARVRRESFYASPNSAAFTSSCGSNVCATTVRIELLRDRAFVLYGSHFGTRGLSARCGALRDPCWLS